MLTFINQFHLYGFESFCDSVFFPPDLLNKRIKNEGSRKCIGKGGREEERKEEEDGKEIDVK